MAPRRLTITLAAATTFAALGGSPRLVDLGVDVSAFDVSSDGTVVVGHLTLGFFEFSGFRWTEQGGFELLAPPPGSQNFTTNAWGVSGDGRVVVGIHNDGQGPQAFRWAAETAMVMLGDLPGGEVFAHAHGASHDGAIVVGFGASEHSERIEAFRWTAETGMVGMGDLEGGFFLSDARDITPDGTVIAGYSIGMVSNEAFRWTEETGMVALGGFPGAPFPYTRAFAVSADGSTIVGDGVSFNRWEAFRWTAEEGVVGLGDLPGGSFGSFARDVSGDGSRVIGQGWGETSTQEAFIWDAQRGMRNLNDALRDEFGVDLTGWRLASATAISDDGRAIVGAMLPDPPAPYPDHHGYIVYLGDPPCPADLDGDGAVGLLDLNTLLLNFGRIAGAEPQQGDLDRDGDIDVADLAALLSAFGGACG